MACPSVFAGLHRRSWYNSSTIGHLYDILRYIIFTRGTLSKIIITLPEDMHKALRDIAKKEDRVISALVRRSIYDFLLKNYGIEVEHSMNWGKSRDADDDKDADS